MGGGGGGERTAFNLQKLDPNILYIALRKDFVEFVSGEKKNILRSTKSVLHEISDNEKAIEKK